MGHAQRREVNFIKPDCHSSSLLHHSAPACFNLPIRHTPLIKPTPLTCALCSALAAFKPQLHTHSLPDCSRWLHQTLRRFSAWSPCSDPTCLRLSWSPGISSAFRPDHDPHLSLSGSAPLAIRWYLVLQSECYSCLLCDFLYFCDSDYFFTEGVQDWVSWTLLTSVLVWFGWS